MRLRLILAFALVVLVSVGSVVLLARLGAEREVRAFMLRGGMVGVDELASSLEDFYAQNGSWQGVESLLVTPMHGMMGRGYSGMMGGNSDQRLRLYDADQKLVADTRPAAGGPAPDFTEAIPLRSSRQTVGYLIAEGGIPFAEEVQLDLLNRLDRSAVSAALIAGLVSLLLALLLAYGLANPIRDLTQAANHLASGDLSKRVKAGGGGEVAELGRTFNQMAESLQQAEEFRRAMTADIAHELRTPLAVQRAQLEAIQDGIYPLTAENLTPVLEQNRLLTRLVDDLRTLALAESGALSLERHLADFPALAQRVIERYAQAGLEIEFQAEPLPPLLVDATRIEQILSNLLENARRFTPRGGKIWVTITATPTQARLTVRDSGPGIPAEALERIFERFYRADRSRSRAEGGSGLGLAIARKLAEAHGGTLRGENHPSGGAVFTLELPRNRVDRERD